MKKTTIPLFEIGLFILAANILIERFVTQLSNWISMPLLLVAIILIVVGGFKAKRQVK